MKKFLPVLAATGLVLSGCGDSSDEFTGTVQLITVDEPGQRAVAEAVEQKLADSGIKAETTYRGLSTETMDDTLGGGASTSPSAGDNSDISIVLVQTAEVSNRNARTYTPDSYTEDLEDADQHSQIIAHTESSPELVLTTSTITSERFDVESLNSFRSPALADEFCEKFSVADASLPDYLVDSMVQELDSSGGCPKGSVKSTEIDVEDTEELADHLNTAGGFAWLYNTDPRITDLGLVSLENPQRRSPAGPLVALSLDEVPSDITHDVSAVLQALNTDDFRELTRAVTSSDEDSALKDTPELAAQEWLASRNLISSEALESLAP